VVIITGTATFKDAVAVIPRPSVTWTLTCDVVAVTGTELAERTPVVAERLSHDGSADTVVHVRDPAPVPAAVWRVRLCLLLILKVKSEAEGCTIARSGLTARVKL
jgi:hypothetical protein